MKAYIQSVGGIPIDETMNTAMYGFKMKGMDVVLYETIDEVPLNRSSIVLGYVQEVREFMQRMEWKIDETITFPSSLQAQDKFWKRPIWKIEAKGLDVYKDAFFLKKFVKPYDKIKGFTAGIITKKEEIDAVRSSGCSVVVSESVEMESEYRCYILRDRILGCYNYLGNINLYPNLRLVEDIIKRFTDAPIAYSIDVAVLSNGETALVEFNHFWSLGNYGLPAQKYTQMYVEGWVEMLKNNPVIIDSTFINNEAALHLHKKMQSSFGYDYLNEE